MGSGIEQIKTEDTPENGQKNANGVLVDRAFTYRVTVASLLVGLVIAAVVGLILFSLARPMVVGESRQISCLIAAIMFLASAVDAYAILYWSIFNLPVCIDNRQGVKLDPAVWPWTGAVMIGIVVLIGFVGAILV